ncbi:hypothetical protein [Bacteroides sp.]|uniref:hypothetical protein n=1 Tax=Bacteroides sp. TaxID=29523 RepID=UPI002636282E|nr:hypothetical protein [Bacteroides sp.]MDD3039779.1 hypothetical protein [Bacteroides sp.]
MDKQFIVEENFLYRGFRGVVVGNAMGHRCGYVGLPKGDVYYGEDYDDIPVKCHGGLTFGKLSPDYPIKDEGEELYWIGFDCAHLNDAKDPELLEYFGKRGKREEDWPDVFMHGKVRTQYEVRREVERIIDQLLLIG